MLFSESLVKAKFKCPVKAIIFDLDETLYDYSTPDHYALSRVGKECVWRGISNTPKEFIQQYHNVVKELFSTTDAPYIYDRYVRMERVLKKLGYPADKNTAGSLCELYWKTFYSKMRIWPDLHPVMEFLKMQGIKIGILTDGLVKWQWEKVRILRIERYIDVFITAEDLGFSKPRKEAFLIALQKIDIPPTRAIMVGDNLEKDILGALRVGMEAIYFDRKRKNETNFSGPRIYSLCGLFSYISKSKNYLKVKTNLTCSPTKK